jgi:hypothetical protein
MRLNCRVTKRLVLAVAVGYVFLALVAAQRRRLASTGECYPDCWCKDPGLSLFPLGVHSTGIVQAVYDRCHSYPSCCVRAIGKSPRCWGLRNVGRTPYTGEGKWRSCSTSAA